MGVGEVFIIKEYFWNMKILLILLLLRILRNGRYANDSNHLTISPYFYSGMIDKQESTPTNTVEFEVVSTRCGSIYWEVDVKLYNPLKKILSIFVPIKHMFRLRKRNVSEKRVFNASKP